MSNKKINFFWVSYSDLITSLFFILLVLFVAVSAIMKMQTQEAISLNEQLNKEIEKHEETSERLKETLKQLRAEASEVEKIRVIKRALLSLEKNGLFIYNRVCERFELKHDIEFKKDKSFIPKENAPLLIEAGRELTEMLQSFEAEKNVRFLVIIEGRAAKHENEENNSKYSDNVKHLSYNRAKAVYQLWKEAEVRTKFVNGELLISGSGFDGECRYEGIDEGKNKRINVLVLPYTIK